MGCFEVCTKDSPSCGFCQDEAAEREFRKRRTCSNLQSSKEKAFGAAFRPYVDPAPLCITGFSTALGTESHSCLGYLNDEWADDGNFHKRQWSAFLQVKHTRALCRDGKFGFNLRP